MWQGYTLNILYQHLIMSKKTKVFAFSCSLSELLLLSTQTHTYTHTIHSTLLRSKVISHQLLCWETCPPTPRTPVAVYRRRPCHLLYPLHFNTGQETDWGSGDANEISPPQHPSSILSGYCLHPGHINQTVRERGGGLKEEKGGRDGGRWSGGEKRETGLMAKLSSSRSSRWLGWCKEDGTQGNEKAQCPPCSVCHLLQTNFLPGALLDPYSLELLKRQNKK